MRENAGNLERGFFMWNNTPFKAVHAQPLVPQLLPPPPKTQPRPVTIQQRPAPPPPVAPAMPVRPAYIYAADTEVIDAEPAPAPAQPAPVQPAPAPAAQHPEVGQAFERTIQEAAGKGLDPKRFEKLVKEWILADPTTRLNSRDPKTGELNGAGATEVADLMAGQDAQQFGGPRSKDDYKSLAHGMLKAARRQIIAGGNIGTQKIGSDRTETIPAAPPPEDPLE